LPRESENSFLAEVDVKPASCPAIPAGDLWEEVMKTNLLVIGLAFLLTAPAVRAMAVSSKEWVQGTVVQVQKQRVQSPAYQFGSGNPSDAPLASQYYAFEVSIRVDCETYVGRYTTPFNYLPGTFTVDQAIQFRLTKHVMYFELPDGWDVRMGIVRRFDSCSTKR
jgi:hypothetical protein